MQQISKLLYIFLGAHSLLIGMFIFFLPIFLWEQYLGIDSISLFVSLTAISFVLGLTVWDRLRFAQNLSAIIAISFIFEIFLISLGFFSDSSYYLFLAAIIYGIYNCFFWVTQRLMFLENAPSKSVGKQYGTIQILAFILLKVGIILGAFLLESTSFFFLWLSVSTLSLAALAYFLIQKNISSHFHLPLQKTPTSMKELFSFKDEYRSKFIFFLDGPFLFFESFFWVISLYLLSNQSYTNLGIITVVLALSFAGLFGVIRQYIDRMNVKYVFYASTLLYAFSWLLRGYVPEIGNIIVLGIIVFIIAFCTSLFRLSFNKQFFDLAKNVPNNKYIVIKSYYSQISIAIVFAGLAYIFSGIQNSTLGLSYLYYVLAFVSLLYLVYKPHVIS